MKFKLEMFEGDAGWWVVNTLRPDQTEWSINFDTKEDALKFMVAFAVEFK
jgi:hypothetical protein